jgi:pimeloyl-ACP methyl ester carboxylesterase
MNGIKGKMLYKPSQKKDSKLNILIVTGKNVSLESLIGVAEDLSKYGSVTCPNLPGYGGMQNFFRIKEKPSIDSFADYMAAFIKLKFNRKRLVIFGVEEGFVIITRMLQRYPQLAKKIDLLFCVSSIAHKDDLKIGRVDRFFYSKLTLFFSFRPFSSIYRIIFLQPPIFYFFYLRSTIGIAKYKGLGKADLKIILKNEMKLRLSGNIRTRMRISHEIINLDNCQQRINLPIWHLTGIADSLINNNNTEQHLRIIFNGYNNIQLSPKPGLAKLYKSVQTEPARLIPPKVKQLLRQQARKV